MTGHMGFGVLHGQYRSQILDLHALQPARRRCHDLRMERAPRSTWQRSSRDATDVKPLCDDVHPNTSAVRRMLPTGQDHHASAWHQAAAQQHPLTLLALLPLLENCQQAPLISMGGCSSNPHSGRARQEMAIVVCWQARDARTFAPSVTDWLLCWCLVLPMGVLAVCRVYVG